MSERLKLIISSASIPFAFPPQNVDRMLLVDGGLMSNISIGDPIERCREDGYRDENIVMDMLLPYQSPFIMDEWKRDLTWSNAFDYFMRRKKITNYYLNTEEVQRLFRGFHEVNFRLVV